MIVPCFHFLNILVMASSPIRVAAVNKSVSVSSGCHPTIFTMAAINPIAPKTLLEEVGVV